MGLPSVALVGRPNVGKSSLLNAAVGRRMAIVDARPGTTLDRVAGMVRRAGRRMEWIDTAGLTGELRGAEVVLAAEGQVSFAVETADLVLHVTDVRDGVHPLDQMVSRRLHEAGRPVLVVVNKVDTAGFGAGVAAFSALGHGEPIGVSALTKFGLPALWATVAAALPPKEQEEEDPIHLRLGLVGRRNVGKSTLLNRLAGGDRVVVSDVPGTTRDAVEVAVTWRGRRVLLVDTAGYRRRGKMDSPIDHFAVLHAESALRHCDVALFLLDGVEEVTKVDRRLGDFLEEQGLPTILVVNKWDLARARDAQAEDYETYLRGQLPGLSFAPICIVSAATGFNLGGIVELAEQLRVQANTRLPTSWINRLIDRVKEGSTAPRARRTRPKIYFASQTETRPPTFSLQVNDPALFSPAFSRFLCNRLRAEMPFPEVPIRIRFVRKGAGAPRGEAPGRRPARRQAAKSAPRRSCRRGA